MLNNTTAIPILKRPYFFETSFSQRWFSCIRFAVFVFLFLLIFQPFGLSNLSSNLVLVALGYGLTTFLVMSVLNIAFVSFFPKSFPEESWTVKKEILWNLLNVFLIGLANAFYSSFIGMVSLSLTAILVFEMFTVSIGILPIVITTLIKESQLKKKFELHSIEINKEIATQHKEENNPAAPFQITIHSENEKDQLQIPPGDLIYIQSSDNYVEVYYRQDKKITKKLVRNSLKSIAFQLAEHKQVFRCHKSFLVDLEKVKHVSGNAQGYKLHLQDVDILIPVSRQFNEEIRKRLGA